MTQIATIPQSDDLPDTFEQQVVIDVPTVSASTELELSDEEAKEVLRDPDLFHVNLVSIRANRKLGKYLKKAGLVEYARGKLLGREHCLERARLAMMNFVEGKEPCENPERIGAAHVIYKLIQAENETTKLGLELEKIAHEIASTQKSGHLPPPAGALVVVHSDGNVNIIESSPDKG